MPENTFPFHRRILFRLLLPVIVVGIVFSTFLVFYMTAPLERYLTRQLEANLELSSHMGLLTCEEQFNYMLELRLEKNIEMNQVMQNEVLEKIQTISRQFPNIHLMILESGNKIRANSFSESLGLWKTPEFTKVKSEIVFLNFDSEPIRAYVQFFPFWDWHIISFVFEKDYKAPIKMVYTITFLSAACVFLVVVGTLLFSYYLFINNPLQRLIRATDSVTRGELTKIDRVEDNELGHLMVSFNSMVDSLDKEKKEVSKLIEQLTESEAMFRSQFEFGNIGIAITSMENGQVRANDRLCQILGYTPEELRGINWAELSHPDDLPADIACYKRLLSGEIDNYEMDKRVFNKDGDVLYTHINVSCDRKSDGTTRFVIVSILDISDRKKAAAELQRFRNYLSSIIDSMPSMLVAVDKNLRVTQWNKTAEQITGQRTSDVLGEIAYEVSPLLAGDRQIIEGSIKTKQINRDINRPVQSDSGRKYYDLTVFPLIDNDEEGAVIRFDDVTEKHLMQEQLNHRTKMDAIGQLAGGVAHDFNNMLGGIIGAAELLGQKITMDSSTMNLHRVIVEAAERAAELTQKLLAFARKQHPASTPIDMHQTIHDTVAILDKSIDKRIRIEVNTAADETRVVGDSSQLQSIILNLGINSSHAMPNGGGLTISTSNIYLDETFCRTSNFELTPGDYLKIEVRDNGCGIEPDDLPHIFEPFYTTKSQGEGTGLGLAAVFGTMQQHCGAISVYSEVGHGTSFYLYFPLTDRIIIPKRLVNELLYGTGTILVVDDEELMRISAKSMLENIGYDILLAENGKEALNLFEKKWDQIDLVLLDMIMPEMNGRDCYHALRQINPDVRVVLSSGFSREEDIAEMRKEGLAGFICKPYNMVDLSREVNFAISQNAAQ